jgi:hypothetical protein
MAEALGYCLEHYDGDREMLRVLRILETKDYFTRVMSVRRANMIAAWPLWDIGYRTIRNMTGTEVKSVELIGNGGFETAGAGGADVFDVWTEAAGTGAIADEGELVHGGSHAAKLTAGATANTTLRPSNASSLDATGAGLVGVFPGMRCTLSFWTRGDGANAGRYAVYDNSNGAYIRTTVSSGVTGTTYTRVSYSFTVPAGCYAVQVTLFCPAAEGGIAYFDDVSLVSDYPLDGLAQPSGVSYGRPGIGDGLACTEHNGTDSGILIGNVAFGQLWDGNVGSAISWGKVDAASRWTDAAAYRYPFHVKSRQDSTVYLAMGKSQTNHQVSWRRRIGAGNVNPQFEYTYTFSPSGPTGWFCQGMTWDVVSSPKKIKCFLYAPGVLEWTKLYDDTPATGLEDWVNATYTPDGKDTVLAAGSLTAQEWIGRVAHVYLWAGAALTDDEMRRAMSLEK